MRAARRPRAGLAIDACLGVFVLAMTGLMVALPGHEAAPFHIMFLGVAVVYGFRVWPVVPTAALLVAMTLPSGWLMWTHAEEGFLARAELAEIPLLPMVVGVMVWHAQRRASALRQVEEMAARQLAGLEREREFFRDTSHAIRTPVTIARGHLELAAISGLTAGAKAGIAVALNQLERMSALSNRLLALARPDSGVGLRRRPTDLSELVEELGTNWSASADRRWQVRNHPTGLVTVDPEWITLAIDALIENAVHFTSDGDTITLGCRLLDRTCVVTVEDSGPGIEAEDLDRIFDRFWHRMPPHGPMGSGLGLPMARATATAHGGSLTAANRPLGGAVFELTLPR
ncbi:signal transduction histidine kinase [Kribbella voronezhensis]|uniref:histidine kinase n=1 Tax=Kribbella voronezhensis TaxID=2512212 RepID=A0A4R7SZG3_9ACTN|nr:HAMP domain-containing sensor histidine kinase [Kribbella voronezhensis]TDU83947.1 signal transduction histidine kinase [Kribbella voronezhensis]